MRMRRLHYSHLSQVVAQLMSRYSYGKYLRSELHFSEVYRGGNYIGSRAK